jgi:predicted component of viral defense system (DUF524 family)
MSALSLETLEESLASRGTSPIEDADLFSKPDLYKAHSYRDALLGSRGAYVLFPAAGMENNVFVRSRSADYRSKYKIPSVGAFPLTPQQGGQQLSALAAFLREVFMSLSRDGSAYIEESGFP